MLLCSFLKDGRFHQMKTRTVLVTGSSGLIGSEAVEHFERLGHQVHGIDNNMRRVFLVILATPAGISTVCAAQRRTSLITI
jgi:nucleoside-diphosphate-sugar epimerase